MVNDVKLTVPKRRTAMYPAMYLERSNVASIHIYGVKCVLTGNDISDDLQPIRKQSTGQGRVQWEES